MDTQVTDTDEAKISEDNDDTKTVSWNVPEESVKAPLFCNSSK